MHPIPSTKPDFKNSLRTVIYLTPDDILTLKLLRDQWRPETVGRKYKPELQRALETLERILKQVG
jgi:hypothetical protein